MDTLKATVAANLIRLRTSAEMTQAQLAQLLHYSDKAVSKWERGESLPDVAVLKLIADHFGVTVDYLITAHEGAAPVPTEEKRGINTRVLILLSLVAVWTVAALIYIVFWMLGRQVWMVGVAAMPVSLITLLVFNSLWNRGRFNMWIVAALIPSVFLLIYGSLYQFNPWQMFLLLVPAEAIVFLSFHIRRRKNKR